MYEFCLSILYHIYHLCFHSDGLCLANGWAAAAAAIGQAAGAVAQSGMNANAVKGANREASNNAKQLWWLDQWANDPWMQVQRLKNAGLNPALMYGSSPGQIGGASPQAPEVNAPEYDVAQHLGNAVGSFIDMRQADSNIKTQESQQYLNTSQALKNAEDSAKTASERKRLDSTFDSFIDAVDTDVQIKKKENERKAMENAVLPKSLELGIQHQELENEERRIRNKYAPAKAEVEILNMRRDAARKYIENLNLDKRVKTEIAKMSAEIQNLRRANKGMSQDQIIKKWKEEASRRGLDPDAPYIFQALQLLLGR